MADGSLVLILAILLFLGLVGIVLVVAVLSLFSLRRSRRQSEEALRYPETPFARSPVRTDSAVAESPASPAQAEDAKENEAPRTPAS